MPVLRLLHSARRLAWPVQSHSQGLFTAFMIVCIIALEIFGRLAKSDLHDGMYALALVCLVFVVSLWHQRKPLPWVSWLVTRSRNIAHRIGEWQIEKGFDFRGDPPIPRHTPLALWGFGLMLVLWSVTAIGVWYILPGGWRELGMRTSYVIYLTVLLVLWTTLIVSLIAGLAIPVVLLERVLRSRMNDGDRRSVTLLLFIGYLFTITAMSAFLPLLGVFALCAIALAVALVKCLFVSRAGVSVILRSSSTELYSLPIVRVIALVSIFVLLLCMNVILTASCGRITTRVEATDVMPVTAKLAALVAWTFPMLLGIVTWWIWNGRRSNPAYMTPPTVNIETALTREEWSQARQVIRNWGWNVKRFQKAASKDDVRIRLVRQEESEATEFAPQWPLKVSLADLANPDVKDRLLRRDEIQLRRRFQRGMRRVYKIIARVKKLEGCGYWLAPQWWFIRGMAREEVNKRHKSGEPESTLRRIGPDYETLLGRRARQHWYRALRAAQLDVIYFEDGVPVKCVEKILKTILELYDRTGGQKAAGDQHFSGIPKVRVVIHEFTPEKPPLLTTFKQPKFDDLSRGRIMHIFRDKGDHEEVSDMPYDFNYEPSPMLSV